MRKAVGGRHRIERARPFRDRLARLFALGSEFAAIVGVGLFDAGQTRFASGELTSRLEGTARVLVVRGVIDTTPSLGPTFSIAAIGQMQWANDPLPNYEEFALGCFKSGRRNRSRC
ncbi:hypothetical protein HMP09_2780 [Sphingomonas sp. HMP9]|uniref:hypothetical protein n=1 Tax=Sphingomonas sp. HMP9 TaxID=1517554 RepID=UPI001596A480|nr:hypothetical protein [Sphingomonas sp. HMP9]BCA63546.1 hypothetical protein HMP09_2780 [Sphingomonas sp. HMP9]